MKGVKELKVRIKSVRNIQKITRAMEMVASTKLRKLQDRALATRPFAERVAAMMKRVAGHAGADASPLLVAADEVTAEAVIVVGADKGLCGAYNANLLRRALAHVRGLKNDGVKPHLYLLGRRPQQFFKKWKDVSIDWVYGASLEKITYPDVRRILGQVVDRFLAGDVQRVTVVYTRMKSMALFTPDLRALLPVTAEAQEGDAAVADVDYILEPSPVEIMKRLLPRHLEMQLYAAILESLASEFASRRVAMKSATDAAQDMLGTLGMAYNKARQEGITSELLDIVGGVSAQGA